jgi:hypothetical protein
VKEKFLVLEVTPQGTNGLFLSVDEDRNILFEKSVYHADLSKILASPVRRLSEKSWEGKHLFRSRRRVIAAADSSLATTIPVPLELSRDRANVKTKLTVTELENLIAQAMAKIFNGCRSEVGKRFGIDELDVVLVGAQAKYWKVDGRPSINPVGLVGKKISLLLELTFTTRDLFEGFRPFFNAPDEFFFAEVPQAHLSALSRIKKLPLSLIMADRHGARLYILDRPKGEHEVLYREKFGWPSSSLSSGIKESLAVTGKTAEALYERYHRGEVSVHAGRAFQNAVAPALQALLKEMERVKLKGTVYFEAPHALPFALPHKHGAATLEAHPIHELLKELGFTVDLHAVLARVATGDEKNALRRLLLYFLEAYFDRSRRSEINQKLHRRLHWLAG